MQFNIWQLGCHVVHISIMSRCYIQCPSSWGPQRCISHPLWITLQVGRITTQSYASMTCMSLWVVFHIVRATLTINSQFAHHALIYRSMGVMVICVEPPSGNLVKWVEILHFTSPTSVLQQVGNNSKALEFSLLLLQFWSAKYYTLNARTHLLVQYLILLPTFLPISSRFPADFQPAFPRS